MLQAPFSFLRHASKTIVTVSTRVSERQFPIKDNCISTKVKCIKADCLRSFSTTPLRGLKDIIETIEGGETVVEGVKLGLPRGDIVRIKTADGKLRSIFDDREFWSLLSHTDVLILRQFLNTDYTVLPIEITQLRIYQQERIEHLVRKAQRANLIPMKVAELKDTVAFSSEIKHGIYNHKNYNSYYDDWDKLY